MKAFIFSGLGADHRVFEAIDFGPFNPQFIPWTTIAANETLASYALQMSQGFPKDEPFILIGISFGGILAQEVARFYPNASILLIATVQSKSQLPFFMRLTGKLKLHKRFPIQFALKFNRGAHWFFGCQSNGEKAILNQILQDTNPTFARWAIGEIAQWNQLVPTSNPVFHIHGDSDRIFPIKQVNPDKKIKNGSHFMTVSQPDVLSKAIQEGLHFLTKE